MGFDYESTERTPLTRSKQSDIGSDMSGECCFDHADYEIAHDMCDNELGYGIEE